VFFWEIIAIVVVVADFSDAMSRVANFLSVSVFVFFRVVHFGTFVPSIFIHGQFIPPIFVIFVPRLLVAAIAVVDAHLAVKIRRNIVLRITIQKFRQRVQVERAETSVSLLEANFRDVFVSGVFGDDVGVGGGAYEVGDAVSTFWASSTFSAVSGGVGLGVGADSATVGDAVHLGGWLTSLLVVLDSSILDHCIIFGRKFQLSTM